MSGLKFGTSGLRGLVSELDAATCSAYTIAFLKHVQESHGVSNSGQLLVGYDLRGSSPVIAAACVGAARAIGMTVENCGPLPTPALALRALSTGAPAIMVTGSHIPADRNGLKFYRPDGEIDKQDEAGILTHLDLGALAPAPTTVGVSTDALGAYAARCRLLAVGGLKGLRVGVYQHSSVGRDLMVDILREAGATAVALARSEVFVPVDTEALRPEDIAFAAAASKENRLDAIVSTDGDADRPLIADENGIFLRGDSVGMLTAQFLGADAVVTPVTSNTAVELSGLFGKVYRTRVGSPYVIEGMQAAARDGSTRIVGFEANGGVLLGSPMTIDGRTIDALPTRDAMLPILGVLGMAARQGVTVSALQGTLPARYTRSGRIEHVDAAVSAPFLRSLLDEGHRRAFFTAVGGVAGSDAIDGVRVILSGGEVVHFRASGNAPELRCYAEASAEDRSDELLQWGLKAAAGALRAKEAMAE